MSLATRCTACGTVFRVVQDQLKVSEGWVRCGRCSEVFNAREGLFDLEQDPPPVGPTEADTPPVGASVASSDDASALVNSSGSARDEAAPTAEELAAVEAANSSDELNPELIGLSRESGQGSTPTTRIIERDRLEFPDAQFDREMLTDDIADVQLPIIKPAAAQQPVALDTGETPSAPGFVQHAQRKARWTTPGMRALQALALVVLVALLGLQAVYQFRDLIAARWPAAGPTLTAWCAIRGCAIDPVRRIDDIAVESTALTRASLPEALQLSVVLRNRGTVVTALPSIDLSLTDVNGQVLSRRVLAPRDFRVASTSIRPGVETTLQLVLSTGDARVTGYTVELFYP